MESIRFVKPDVVASWRGEPLTRDGLRIQDRDGAS